MTKENEQLLVFLGRFQTLENILGEMKKNPQEIEKGIAVDKEACNIIYPYNEWFADIQQKGVTLNPENLTQVRETINRIRTLLDV